MKPKFFLASAVALIAIAGCNSNAGDAATGGEAHFRDLRGFARAGFARED